MGMSAEEITAQIKVVIADAEILLEDLAGDNDHWKITVTSKQFAGKSRIEQHRMVMSALKGMGTTLHALSITTKAG